MIYRVTCRDIRDLSPRFAIVRGMLDQAAEAAGDVLQRVVILTDGLHGVEYEIKTADGAHKFYRYLQRRKRLYILFVKKRRARSVTTRASAVSGVV